MVQTLEIVLAYLKAAAFNAVCSVGGLVVMMVVFGLRDVEDWAVLAILSWLIYSTSSTILGSILLD